MTDREWPEVWVPESMSGNVAGADCEEWQRRERRLRFQKAKTTASHPPRGLCPGEQRGLPPPTALCSYLKTVAGKTQVISRSQMPSQDGVRLGKIKETSPTQVCPNGGHLCGQRGWPWGMGGTHCITEALPPLACPQHVLERSGEGDPGGVLVRHPRQVTVFQAGCSCLAEAPARGGTVVALPPSLPLPR